MKPLFGGVGLLKSVDNPIGNTGENDFCLP